MIWDMLKELKGLSLLRGWYKSPHSITNEGLLCPCLGRKPKSLFWYWNKAVPFQTSQERNCSFLRLSCTYAISLLSSFLNFCSLAPVAAACVIASPERRPGKPSPGGAKAAQLSQHRHSYKWAAAQPLEREGENPHLSNTASKIQYRSSGYKACRDLTSKRRAVTRKGREALVATAGKSKGEMDKQKNTFSCKITISLNVITL